MGHIVQLLFIKDQLSSLCFFPCLLTIWRNKQNILNENWKLKQKKLNQGTGKVQQQQHQQQQVTSKVYPNQKLKSVTEPSTSLKVSQHDICHLQQFQVFQTSCIDGISTFTVKVTVLLLWCCVDNIYHSPMRWENEWQIDNEMAEMMKSWEKDDLTLNDRKWEIWLLLANKQLYNIKLWK